MAESHIVKTVQPGSEPPEWTDRFIQKVVRCWKSPGGATCLMGKSGSEVQVYVTPSVREIVGGKRDGSKIFPPYSFNMRRFATLFNSKPDIYFYSGVKDGMPPHVRMIGDIDDNRVVVHILPIPPEEQDAVEIAYDEGPKKGTVEGRPPNLKAADDEESQTEE